MARNGMAKAALRGAIGGAIATWLMGRATTRGSKRESSKPARRRGDEGRPQGAATAAIHWALGIGTGALYGALRSRAPILGLGRGLVFGTAFWLVVDELAIPALGLTPDPRALPWQSRARGLAGHLAYGAALTAAVDAVEAVG